MCRYYLGLIITLSIFCASIAFCKKHKRKILSESESLENEIWEKSEVVFKFPVYAVKMPPMISTRRRTDNFDPAPVSVSCRSSNVTKAIDSLRRKTKCIPRDTVVDITAPDGFEVAPSSAVVKRCGGMCSGGKKCLPTKRTQAEFYVKTMQESSLFCNLIKIPEDLECKCGCGGKSKKKCGDKQKFEKNTCSCICKNIEEKHDCLNKMTLNFKWDQQTCSCICRNKRLCTTGTEWSTEKCKCLKSP